MKLGFLIDPHLSNTSPSGRVDDYPETILGKVSASLNLFKEHGVDRVYLTGDVFNSLSVSFAYYNRVVDLFRCAGVRVWSIVGNHTGDMRYDRVDTLPETPLGALFGSGAVGRLTDSYITERETNKETYVFGCDYKCPVPTPVKGAVNILVAHSSYGDCWGEHGIDPKELKGFQFAVLGHDHNQYPIEMTEEGCMVVRPGSVSRGTAGFNDRTRIPKVAIIDLNTMQAEYHTIPHKSASEVFSTQVIQKNESNVEIKDYVKSLSDVKVEAVETVSSLVTQYATDPAVMKRVVEHFQKAGIW